MFQKLTRNEKVACSNHVTSLQNTRETDGFPGVFYYFPNFLSALFFL